MYHELVHLLDLCTFAYQLHNQTLIWPTDPYYKQWSSNLLSRAQFSRRKEFMTQVHRVATLNRHELRIRHWRSPMRISYV